MEVIALITQSGKTAFELAFFILLPLITVMTTLLAISSKLGLLGLLERGANRLIGITGLSGLSLVAFIQMNFVSFAAPIGTLKVMDQTGQADRVFAVQERRSCGRDKKLRAICVFARVSHGK